MICSPCDADAVEQQVSSFSPCPSPLPGTTSEPSGICAGLRGVDLGRAGIGADLAGIGADVASKSPGKRSGKSARPDAFCAVHPFFGAKSRVALH